MGCGASTAAVPSGASPSATSKGVPPGTEEYIAKDVKGDVADGMKKTGAAPLQGSIHSKGSATTIGKSTGFGNGAEQEDQQLRALKAMLTSIKTRGSLAHALGHPDVPDSGPGLSDLADGVYDLHEGMPPAIKRAPLRLLRIASVLAWDFLPVFEAVLEADYLEVPYSDTDDALWQRVVTVSWRWAAQKPSQMVEGFSPMSGPQFAELKALLGVATERGLEYVWIDWSCVPQYRSSAMVEVHRSKVFYARSRSMLVLPTLQPLPEEGPVRVILGKAKRVLQRQAAAAATATNSGADAASLPAAVAAELLTAMLDKNQVAGREYFGRVWTLAERMARYGRDEGLCHWLSLEAWLGMLVDAMLKSTEDRASSRIYQKMLGADAAALLEAVLEPLAAAVHSSSVLAKATEGLDARVAELCRAAVCVWQQPRSLLAEAPTRQWLDGYLGEEARSGVYQAWSEADRVWAVYSYFCWRANVDHASPEGLRTALEDLVVVASGDRAAYLAGMFAQLGLAQAAQANGTSAAHGGAITGDQQALQATVPTATAFTIEPPRTARAAAAAAGPAQIVPTVPKAGAAAGGSGSGGPPPQQQAGAGAGNAGDDAAGRGEQGGAAAAPPRTGAPRVGQRNVQPRPDAAVRVAKTEREQKLLAASKAGTAAVITSLLSDPVVNPNVTNEHGWTALHTGSYNGYVEVVRALLAAGADTEVKKNDGYTALHTAAFGGHRAVVEALLEAGANMEARDNQGGTALHIASSDGGQLGVVQLLLASGADVRAANNVGYAAMHVACQAGNTEVVKALLAAKADMTAAEKGGAAALHLACQHGRTEVVRILLAAGAPVAAKKPDGTTPLHCTCYGGQLEVAQMLLAAGADVAARDRAGNTPLHIACETGYPELVQALLAAGAHLTDKKEGGFTPLHSASYHGQTDVVNALIAADADLTAKQSDGRTALYCASERGHGETVQALLKAGADVTSKDTSGRTALHAASYSGSRDVVNLLLAAGADIEAKTTDGTTALHLACKNWRCEDVIKLLLEAGADTEAKDKTGDTPLDYLRRWGNAQVVRLVQSWISRMRGEGEGGAGGGAVGGTDGATEDGGDPALRPHTRAAAHRPATTPPVKPRATAGGPHGKVRSVKHM